MKAHEYNILLNDFSAPLLRYAYNFLRDEEESKDIVQDVFEKLWIHREKIQLDKVKSWLFTCAHNAMINRINKQKRTCEFDLNSHEKGKVEAMQFESNQIIDLVVSGLPPIQKSILLLRDLQGYRYDEIGEILSLSPSQVKVYLFRARTKIKNQLIQLKEVHDFSR